MIYAKIMQIIIFVLVNIGLYFVCSLIWEYSGILAVLFFFHFFIDSSQLLLDILSL